MGIARSNAIIAATVGTTTLVGLEGYAFKFHTDGTVIPIAAIDDLPAGVILEGAAVGGQCSVALISAAEPLYVKLSTAPGTVIRGTLLEITADGSFKADAGTAGTVCAIALETGTAGEFVEAALLKTAGTVTLDGTRTTCAADADGATLTVSGAVNAAGTYLVGVYVGEAAGDGTPHDFGDVAVTAGSGCVIVNELTADALLLVQTKSDGTWSLDFTVAADDTVYANAFVMSGPAATASAVVDVP